MKKLLFPLLLSLFLPSLAWGATYYVDATGGSDTNSGTATDQAWKTISKVNSTSFSNSDSILFKKGEVWRDQLIPQSGTGVDAENILTANMSSAITYGAYGSGNK